jgi:ABC-type transport system involved in multi-copper enzyme maturation permease subunit
MIGTLAWKEYREHQTVWVAMVALAVFLIITLTQVWAPHGVAAAPADKLHMIALAALILAGMYGLICGAIMVAGEEEARTQTYLDSLPAHRFRLWMTKLLMGGLFSLAYALVVNGVTLALGLTETKALPAGWQLALPFVALEAFGYGLFGSVMGRSVLAAVVWGLVPVTISWILGGAAHWIWSPPADLHIVVRSVFLLATLALTGLIYCRPDLQRGLGDSVDLPARRAVSGQGGWNLESNLSSPRRTGRDAGSVERWGVLIWLALRQGGPQLVLFLPLGFVVGLLLPNAALTIWPIATLLVGVAFGIGMFGGEQNGEAYRFLGDQRLSPDRVWLAKATTWAAMAAGVIGVMLLGTAVRLAATQPPHFSVWRDTPIASVLGSRVLLDYVPKDVFVLLWPVYGFGVGQLLALACRKSVVALVLSLLVSVPVVGIWIPSLVAGGLKLWQVLPFAAVLLLATRSALWAWAGALLKTWRPVLGLLACVTLAGIWLAGNLVYRAIEVPAVGEPFNVAAFFAHLPAPEDNRVGALVHRAVQELGEREGFLRPRPTSLPAPGLLSGEAGGRAGGAPDMVDFVAPPDHRNEDPIAGILEQGWPQDDAQLESWLDQLCQGEWIDHLRAAAAVPLGVVENPRLISASVRLTAQPLYQRVAQLLAARALQLQARGEHARALEHLLWALALSRNLRHHSVEVFYEEGRGVEAIALQGLDRWLERLGPQADLLQRALDELHRHEELTPLPTEPIQAEYVILRERLDGLVSGLLPGAANAATAALEYDLITLMLQTPWERERAARFLDALTRSRLKEAQTPYWQLPVHARIHDAGSVQAEDVYPAAFFVPDGDSPVFTSEQWQRLLTDSRLLLRLFAVSSRPQHEKQAFALCRVRAARLKLALALYQVHKGNPAPALRHLVPRYLEELPSDPFNGESFHYRVARRERIAGGNPAGAAEANLSSASDVGILWSVGPNGTQSVGRRGGPPRDPGNQEPSPLTPGQVFIVPSWSR